MDYSMPGFSIHHQLPELAQTQSIELVMPSNHLSFCRPLLFLPSIFPSIRVFSNESVLHIQWPKYWSFTFSISPSNEYSGLISFRMDWLDLLAVQGTLKSLLQHHSSKASIFQCSAFFTVQLTHACITTGKTIALTRQTFVGKVMSLLWTTTIYHSHKQCCIWDILAARAVSCSFCTPSTQKRSWHPGGHRNIYLICEWWLNTKMCSNINTVNDCFSGVPFSFMVTLETVWFMQEGQSRQQCGNEGRKNYAFFLAPMERAICIH